MTGELPIVHIDRPVDPSWGDGRFQIVGPGDDGLEVAQAAVVGGVAWGAERFDQAPGLDVLARTGIGFDAVDLDEATRRGVLVTNTPDGPTVSTAEHTMALLFGVAKTIPAHQDRLRRASGNYALASTATELDGLTLGLVAYGRIGRRVARMAAAVGMQIIVFDPYLDPSTLSADDPALEIVDFGEILARSDVISLHAPLTEETRHLIDRAALDRCRPGVILINAARGPLIDHQALVDALDQGQVGAAGLDVTEPEPLDSGHTLLHRDNVIVTPHVASSTEVGRDRMLSMAIEQIETVLAGGRPSHLVNVDLWPDGLDRGAGPT